jgi:hypothetical protein
LYNKTDDGYNKKLNTVYNQNFYSKFYFKIFLNEIKKFLGGNRSARSKTTRKLSRWNVENNNPPNKAKTAADLAGLKASVPKESTACVLVLACNAWHFSSTSSSSFLAPGEEQSAVPGN